MFNNAKRPEPAQAIHTLLGKGTLWKGEIQAGQNSLRIEGTVEGTITSDGEVTIAPSGEVRGTIHAKHLIVTGRVIGIFKIVECLEIHGTGYVEGEVEVGSLVVDEGGTLQGNCTRRGIVQEPVLAQLVAPALPPAPTPTLAAATSAPHPGQVPATSLPPLSPLTPAVGHGSLGAARSEELPSDRHVFNMANGLAPASAGEHAYSKTKL